MCVSVREREGERESESERERSLEASDETGEVEGLGKLAHPFARASLAAPAPLLRTLSINRLRALQQQITRSSTY